MKHIFDSFSKRIKEKFNRILKKALDCNMISKISEIPYVRTIRGLEEIPITSCDVEQSIFASKLEKRYRFTNLEKTTVTYCNANYNN